MNTWISVNDKPVPYDCDVVICHRGHIRLDGAWKKGLRVSLARAWVSETARIIPWLENRSFFRWPDRELIPYSEITHWMPFGGFPKPPAGEEA